MKTICQCDITTGEFLYELTAREDPENPGEFLLPAGCVEKQPPKEKTGYVRVWEENSWVYKSDFRGESVYSITDKTMGVVSALGDIPDGFTLMKPEMTDKWDDKKKKWIPDDALITQQEIEKAKYVISNLSYWAQRPQMEITAGTATNKDKAIFKNLRDQILLQRKVINQTITETEKTELAELEVEFINLKKQGAE